MWGVAVVLSALMMLAIVTSGAHSAAEEQFVDGPIGTSVIQAPDPSKPIDVNEP
jgi:Na+-transporting methylmalonyl-CoA/oxaloacetate decarboxylase gamma subunit